MIPKTKEDVLNLAQDRGVQFIRLQFTDILGTLKNVAITAEQLEKAQHSLIRNIIMLWILLLNKQTEEFPSSSEPAAILRAKQFH